MPLHPAKELPFPIGPGRQPGGIITLHDNLVLRRDIRQTTVKGRLPVDEPGHSLEVYSA